ncbi:hypothetical protein [Nocardiopsis baichengensis]|uniref:hypothetical protein n=1 Tax=Nocardiopsis baichengensis TaxID=280240 RepID=UPI0003480491|nr:hypothetical protein [Nocardiopsis baichengensis]
MKSCHPLAGVVRWINERTLYFSVRLVAPGAPGPDGEGWIRADRLPEQVPGLIDLLMRRSCEGHRTAAAAFLATDVGRQVLCFASASAYLTGRAPELAAERLWVRPDENGRVVEAAVRQGTVGVLPGDPMARRPGVVGLPGDRALDEWFTAGAAAVLDPVVDAVRAATRFGARAQWGVIADAPHAALLAAAEEVGADQAAAWDRAARIVDLLNRDRDRVAPRQRPFTVALAGRPAHRPERTFLVKGGCCFYYRFGDSTCAGCPLKGDDERERLLRERFEPESARA